MQLGHNDEYGVFHMKQHINEFSNPPCISGEKTVIGATKVPLLSGDTMDYYEV